VILRLEPPRDEWSRLAEASGNVFGTPEWAESWWRHYGRGRVEVLEREGVVLPLHVARERPLRLVRLAGHT